MKLKSLSFLGHNIKPSHEDASNRSTYDYAISILKPYLESGTEKDLLEMHDGLSKNYHVQSKKYIHGRYFNRYEEKITRTVTEHNVTGVDKVTMLLINGNSGGQQISEWLKFLNAVDKKLDHLGKDSLAEEAMLSLFDRAHGFANGFKDKMQAIIKKYIPDASRPVGLQNNEKKTLIEFLYLAGDTDFALDALTGNEAAIKQYAQAINRQIESNDSVKPGYHESATSGGVLFYFGHKQLTKTHLDIFNHLTDKAFIEILNNANPRHPSDKRNETEEEHLASPNIKEAYRTYESRINAIIENRFESDFNCREFVIKCVAAAAIRNDLFIKTANQILWGEKGIVDTTYTYSNSYKLLFHYANEYVERRNVFDPNAFKTVIQDMLDAGISKMALKDAFSHDKALQHFKTYSHGESLLKIIVSLEELGIIDMNKKNSRGWNAYSYLGKENLINYKALSNSKQAHQAVDEIMAEMGFKNRP